MRRIGNWPILAAMAGLVAGYVVVLLLGVSVIGALVVGILMAAAAGVTVYGLVPNSRYDADTLQRRRTVLSQIDQVRSQIRSIEDTATRQALGEACDIFQKMLDKAPRGEQQTVAARLGIQLQHVLTAVSIYLEIQANPALYGDSRASGQEMLDMSQQRLQAVLERAIVGMRQLNQGDLTEFKISLEMLAPTDLPEIS